MNRRNLLSLFVASILSGFYNPAFSKGRVTVALRFDKKANQSIKVFSLENPHRVVLDFSGYPLDTVKKYGAELDVFALGLKDVRVANFDTRTVRLVYEFPHRIFSFTQETSEGVNLNLSNFPFLEPNLESKAEYQKVEELQIKEAQNSQKNPISKKITVVIDAGHGGKDPGAVGRSIGLYEKTVTLAMALELKYAFASDPRYNIVLTRSKDEFVPLSKRVQIAQEARADIFISLHADSVKNRKANGISVYALSEGRATSEQAKLLADSENRVDFLNDVGAQYDDKNLAKTLVDLSQTATISDSLKLGRMVLKELKVAGRLHKSEVEQASFAVLTSPNIPSILIECGFISNEIDERHLANPSYRSQIAELVREGIITYVKASKM